MIDLVLALALAADPPGRSADVEVHVPRAEVQKLAIDVENLQARLDLDTSVGDLVRIQAGVVATVQALRMELEGVQAETHLLVRLDRTTEVLAAALDTLRAEPDLAHAPRAATAVRADAVVIPAVPKPPVAPVPVPRAAAPVAPVPVAPVPVAAPPLQVKP